jgi:serine/alanine racemase
VRIFRNYDGIDVFRLFAAFLIVGIHTYPLRSVSVELNFFIVHVLSRIGVPFFLMATGYFLISQYLSGRLSFPLRLRTDRVRKSSPLSCPHGQSEVGPLLSFVKKTGILYLLATIIYLPISIYAGHYSDGNIVIIFIRNLVFDGIFYHLWYLPAAIMGALLVYALGRRFYLGGVFGVAIVLYVFGLLGDSYYGLTLNVSFLTAIYDVLFNIFSFTRNGLFYAPIFLVMGALIRKQEQQEKVKTVAFACTISLILMCVEGMVLHIFDFTRHDSMYIMLIPCMYFLFRLVSSHKGQQSVFLRDTSMWIYILHPFFIIVVRGIGRIAGLTDLLVGNSIIHYIAVCGFSFAAAGFIAVLRGKKREKSFHKCRAWIELDLANLKQNVKVIKNSLPVKCELMPVVKSNAYGHGAAKICRELNGLGIRAFCVASVMEAVELRKKRIKGKILILGYTHPEQFYLLRRHRLMQTVVDLEYAKTLNNFGKKITVHIAIDTGLKRLGELSENTDNILQIFKCENLVVDGIFSHFSGQSEDFTQTQIDKFNDVLKKIKSQGFDVPKSHLQASYGILNRPDLSLDFARVGIALYGAMENPNGEKLLPVLAVKARVSIVKEVRAGESVGYGFGCVAEQNLKIAVLSIGYADGIPRALSCGKGSVLIAGSKVPVVGYVCMDQITVDITHVDNVKQGDVAVLIGKEGDLEISAQDIAEKVKTVPNEILSRLGARLAVEK